MEKRFETAMSKPILIAITGPECTGKTTLTEQLAAHYKAAYIPEYARDYIGSLDKPYGYDDVVHVAENQLKQAINASRGSDGYVFLDTYLEISKVWFKVVYGHYPPWIDDQIIHNKIDLYLLCDTSIPWTADSLRENGGAMREVLYQQYRDEIVRSGCRFVEITGLGAERIARAKAAIELFFPDIYQKI